MKSENGMKKEGSWTSYISRQVSIFKAELIRELGDEPSGRKRVLLALAAQKYGVLLVMDREIKKQQLVSGDSLVPMLSRSYLAWAASFERTLAALLGEEKLNGDFLPGSIQGIDARFRTGNQNGKD